MTLTCKTDDYYEYCAWRHSGGSGQGLRECHFEWKRKHVSGVQIKENKKEGETGLSSKLKIYILVDQNTKHT